MLGKLHDALCKSSEAYKHYMKIMATHKEDEENADTINKESLCGTAKQLLNSYKKVKKEKLALNFDFYMVIEDEVPDAATGEPSGSEPNILKRKLVVWSFNPSFTFKTLIKEEKPRSIILTSGTLVPFETYENEFDI